MRYLLVNHIPAGAGSDPAHLLLPADWARDVGATARAAQAAGIELTIATPFANRPIKGGVEIVPDRAGFEHLTLSFYDSARSFLHERLELTSTLDEAIARADVVQLDHGGYPVSLGHVADPIAKSRRKRTVWIISGDALPQSSLAQSAGNVAKRLVGRSVDLRLRKLLIDHLASASRVICGAAEVKTQLADSHKIVSDCIESVDVLDSEVASFADLEARTRRLLDVKRPIRFVVTGEQNVVAGTEHVLRAMHRCLRLHLPMELVILGDGVERSALLEQAGKLNIASLVRFSSDGAELRDADVWIDSGLTPVAERPFFVPMARGLAPIVYRTHATHPHVVTVPSGYADGLAMAMSDAAIKREPLVARMLAGVEYARSRTLDLACRRRFDLVRSFGGDRSRPAA